MVAPNPHAPFQAREDGLPNVLTMENPRLRRPGTCPRGEATYTFSAAPGTEGNYLDEVWTIDKRSGGVTVADLNDGTGSDRHFYCSNTLYSVYALTDETGAIAEAVQSYDAYGKVSALITGSGSDATWFTSDDVTATNPNLSAIGNPFFYTGQRVDPETGLYYYKNRYYSAELGRFVSRDPIGYLGQSINIYNYVGSRSTRLVDKKGLGPETGGDEECCNNGMLCGIYVKSGPTGVGPGNGIDTVYLGHYWIEFVDPKTGNLASLGHGFGYDKDPVNAPGAGGGDYTTDYDWHTYLRDATRTWQIRLRDDCYKRLQLGIFGCGLIDIGSVKSYCGKMQRGKKFGTPCCDVNCHDAMECLQRKWEAAYNKGSPINYGLYFNNCRMWVKEALDECCLCYEQFGIKTGGDLTVPGGKYPPKATGGKGPKYGSGSGTK